MSKVLLFECIRFNVQKAQLKKDKKHQSYECKCNDKSKYKIPNFIGFTDARGDRCN